MRRAHEQDVVFDAEKLYLLSDSPGKSLHFLLSPLAVITELDSSGTPTNNIQAKSFYDEEEELVDWKFIILCLVMLAAYVGVGMLFYSLVEEWKLVDALFVHCLYFLAHVEASSPLSLFLLWV
jgi:hypothetical protein